MLKVEFKVPKRALKQLQDNINKIPLTDRGEYRTRYYAELNEEPYAAIKQLQKIPPPMNRVPEWTSKAQRGEYFRTRGFGRGIPTVRTNEIVSSFRVTIRANQYSRTYYLINDAPGYDFVMGKYQQRFHRITGWNNAAPIIKRASAAMKDIVKLVVAQAARDVANLRKSR